MTQAIPKQTIIAEIERLAPFHHDVELPYGLRTHAPKRTRLADLVKHAWPSLLRAAGGSLEGQHVLDVACNCGGFSFEAAKAGAEAVLGIEIVDLYLEQANFIKDCLGLSNVAFKKLSAEEVEGSAIGTFDITFCFGILYHLQDPVSTMKKLSSVTRKIMVVDTETIRTPFVRKPIWAMNFPSPYRPTTPHSTTALWREGDHCQFTPNEQAVVSLLKFIGFHDVTCIRPASRDLERRYSGKRFRKRMTFLAIRD